jgi:hypothetical protein
MKKNKFLFLGMLALALTFTLVLAGCPDPAPTKYTVTFNADGGSTTPAAVEVTSGAALGESLPATPGTKARLGSTAALASQANLTFGGWYTAKNGGGTAVAAATPITADTTVYAYWKEELVPSSATVRFDPDQVRLWAGDATNTHIVTNVEDSALSETVAGVGTLYKRQGMTFTGAVEYADGKFTPTSTVALRDDTFVYYVKIPGLQLGTGAGEINWITRERRWQASADTWEAWETTVQKSSLYHGDNRWHTPGNLGVDTDLSIFFHGSAQNYNGDAYIMMATYAKASSSTKLGTPGNIVQQTVGFYHAATPGAANSSLTLLKELVFTLDISAGTITVSSGG